jgi:hypothetical protein
MHVKKHKLKEIIRKLREVEIVLGQGGQTAKVCWQISGSGQTCYCWRRDMAA